MSFLEIKRSGVFALAAPDFGTTWPEVKGVINLPPQGLLEKTGPYFYAIKQKRRHSVWQI